MLLNEKATLLVVDDTPENLMLISNLLKTHYRIKVANNGHNALKISSGEVQPDLILLDIMMPEIDGYEVCRRLKADPKTVDIPVIFLTAKNEGDDEALGFQLGAVDYITKPVSYPVLFARIKTHLAMKRVENFLRDQNAFLENEVRLRTHEIEDAQEITVLTLAALAETRDNDTGNHLFRTQHYVRILAEKLRNHPRFKNFLDKRNVIELLFKYAPLHDIGKVGIPDRILLKPGRFTSEEFEIMKTHTTLGRDAISRAEQQLGVENSFLKYAKEIAYSHQEKWDGSGYPQGLKGEDIPISARLMALADVYDALISRRVYKESMSHEQAVETIIEGQGSHFDPDIVEAFVELQHEFKLIANRFSDAG